MPGVTRRNDDHPRAVCLVPHLGTVDGDALVVVVVRVEERVPQTEVPKGALGGPAPQNKGLVVLKEVAAHGIGSIPRSPSESGRGDRVGGIDSVWLTHGEWHHGCLVPHPGERGAEPAGQISVVLPIGGRWTIGGDLPTGPGVVIRIRE